MFLLLRYLLFMKSIFYEIKIENKIHINIVKKQLNDTARGKKKKRPRRILLPLINLVITRRRKRECTRIRDSLKKF